MLERYLYGFGRDILNDVRQLREQMNRLFSEVMMGDTELSSRHIYPPVNILEKDNQYLIVFEIPGVNKEDVKLMVQDGTLIMEGERKQPQLPEDAQWLRRELDYGKCGRAITLPQNADVNKISAEYKNGLLLVTVGKKAESKPKEVKISVN